MLVEGSMFYAFCTMILSEFYFYACLALIDPVAEDGGGDWALSAKHAALEMYPKQTPADSNSTNCDDDDDDTSTPAA